MLKRQDWKTIGSAGIHVVSNTDSLSVCQTVSSKIDGHDCSLRDHVMAICTTVCTSELHDVDRDVNVMPL